MDRVPGYEPGGRGFNSCQPRQKHKGGLRNQIPLFFCLIDSVQINRDPERMQDKTLPLIEIGLYYSVILLSPVIYIAYLKSQKKIDKGEIRQNITIFGTFYVLIALLGAFAFFRN